ncbi:hypothetical protein BURKHO8Y_580030 [Burkholderia sp. 8Y]|nr:hypothetical protein BURKHO8Y_580030 [Burkholderia sp. 8Y]
MGEKVETISNHERHTIMRQKLRSKGHVESGHSGRSNWTGQFLRRCGIIDRKVLVRHCF